MRSGPKSTLGLRVMLSLGDEGLGRKGYKMRCLHTCSSNFLVLVASELLGAKTKESKTNYIYIYNEKPLHI